MKLEVLLVSLWTHPGVDNTGGSSHNYGWEVWEGKYFTGNHDVTCGSWRNKGIKLRLQP